MTLTDVIFEATGETRRPEVMEWAMKAEGEIWMKNTPFVKKGDIARIIAAHAPKAEPIIKTLNNLTGDEVGFQRKATTGNPASWSLPPLETTMLETGRAVRELDELENDMKILRWWRNRVKSPHHYSAEIKSANDPCASMILEANSAPALLAAVKAKLEKKA